MKKLPPLVSAILSLILISGCKQASNTERKMIDSENEAARDSIHVVLTQYYETMSNRQWPQYRKFFWDGATLATVWRPAGAPAVKVMITTIDEFIRQTASGPDSKPLFEEKMRGDPYIRIFKDIATVWSDYHVKFGTKDSLQEWNGRDVFTLIRDQGNWRITSLAFQ